MTFDTLEFIFIFAPLVFALYWIIPSKTGRQIVLLAASLLFYSFSDLRYLPFLLLVPGLTYITTAQMIRGNRTFWFPVSLLCSLAPLLIFKLMSFRTSAEFFPVGLSFYTFQALTYTLDIYYGRAEKAENWLQFAVFATFFPSVLSGPIARWANQGKQIKELPARLPGNEFIEGVSLFIVGLVSKVIIADSLNRYLVEPLYYGDTIDRTERAWLAAFSFTMQIYFDFYGYSQMARGMGHIFGISLPLNFARPYQAPNIAEFWNRWHMSLSTWFRDYFFMPFSRAMLRRTNRSFPDVTRAVALTSTMVLIGFWHGLSGHFFLWGLYNGVLLVIYHQTRHLNILRSQTFNRFLTFFAVMMGWVMFRAVSIGQALDIYQMMFKGVFSSNTLLEFPRLWIVMSLVLLLVLQLRGLQLVKRAYHPVGAFCFGLALALSVVAMVYYVQPEFVYFSF
jgi:alginate O-acetyltransferase complex protein AlgI